MTASVTHIMCPYLSCISWKLKIGLSVVAGSQIKYESYFFSSLTNSEFNKTIITFGWTVLQLHFQILTTLVILKRALFLNKETHIQVWNMRKCKWWQNVHLWVNYSFKWYYYHILVVERELLKHRSLQWSIQGHASLQPQSDYQWHFHIYLREELFWSFLLFLLTQSLIVH